MSQDDSILAKRFTLAARCGLPMFACAAGYGGYVVFRSTPTPGAYLAIIVGLPAMATMLFVILATVMPNLLATEKLAFPLNITLPMVYAALLLLCVMLLTSTGSNLIIPQDRLRVALFWTHPAVLMLVTLSQILCLTVLAMFSRQPVD